MRTLRLLSADDPIAVLRALEGALTGGDAILPRPADDAVRLGGPASARPAASDPGSSRPVPQNVALVVETSGSTGTSKQVALSSEALLAGAASADAALGGPGRWVLALPTHYIAGLNVLTRSIAAGTTPLVLPPGRFEPDAFADAADRLDADRTAAGTAGTADRRYTSLVPVQLARILDDPRATAALATFDAVLVGGQATPAPLRAAASDVGIRIVTTYGASETSGGCVYDGMPFGTVHARIADGGLELSGPMLAEGYLGDAARTDATFVHHDGRRWYRTADAATIDADGRIQVLGRLDDVIVSGGEKVALGAVERVVRAQPGQAGAVVTRRTSGEWGEVPVVVTDVPLDLDGIRDVVGAALGRASRPAAVVIVDELPMLPSGKPDRVAAARLAAP